MQHVSIMPNEVLEIMRIKKGGFYIDATFGQGGHTERIIEKNGFVLGIDKDLHTNQYFNRIHELYPKNCLYANDTFANIKEIWKNNVSPLKADGILFDLGFSTNQIKEIDGFSYLTDTFLDMRFNRNKGITASEWLNTSSLKEMTDIFTEYGEESKSYSIASAIVYTREKKHDIETTKDLVDIIKTVLKNDINYKKTLGRIFQAIRIHINNELNEVKLGINDAKDLLKQHGILAVITFHSIEDRIVKNIFKDEINELILPSAEEIRNNPKAKNAKLRYMIKC